MTISARVIATAIAVGLFCVQAFPVWAQSEGHPPVVLRAEKCMAENVGRIVAIEPDIQSAANFLVDYACAGEVAAAARYERNLAYVKAATALSKSMTAQSAIPQAGGNSMFGFSAKVDPETGEIITDQPSTGPTPFFQSAFASVSRQNESLGGWAVPTHLRKLAGELVIDARQHQRQ